MATHHVSFQELLAVLNGLKPQSPQIVTIRLGTEPKLLVKHRQTKAPCPYVDGLSRLTYRSGVIGCDYASVVERQRDREGKSDPDAPFEAQELWKGKGKWLDRWHATHVDNGGLYLPFKPAQHASNENLCGTVIDLLEVRWLNNTTGKELTAAEVAELEHYLPPIGKSKVQGVDADVAWRTPKAESITAIHGLEKGGIFLLHHPKH